MVHNTTPDNNGICTDGFELEILGEDQLYSQRGAHLNPVMQANRNSPLANISGDTHMDLALTGDAVNRKFTFKPRVFSALCETHIQARRFQLRIFALFHTNYLGIDRI